METSVETPKTNTGNNSMTSSSLDLFSKESNDEIKKKDSTSNNSCASCQSINTGVKNIVIEDNNNTNKSPSNENGEDDEKVDNDMAETNSISKKNDEITNPSVHNERPSQSIDQPLPSEKVQGVAASASPDNKDETVMSEIIEKDIRCETDKKSAISEITLTEKYVPKVFKTKLSLEEMYYLISYHNTWRKLDFQTRNDFFVVIKQDNLIKAINAAMNFITGYADEVHQDDIDNRDSEEEDDDETDSEYEDELYGNKKWKG